MSFPVALKSMSVAIPSQITVIIRLLHQIAQDSHVQVGMSARLTPASLEPQSPHLGAVPFFLR